MPILSISQISSVVGGELRSDEINSEILISSISIDSRTIFDPASSVFFALKSERNDGHRYIPDLVHMGVRAFIVSDYSDEFQKYDDCGFIVVADTLQALQKLAAWHRSQFQIPVVGITGSNGKTIVKEWLFEVLHNRAVLRSPKSYNSQVGVPLSVWNLGPDDELAIFEAGISKPGEMLSLSESYQANHWHFNQYWRGSSGELQIETGKTGRKAAPFPDLPNAHLLQRSAFGSC